MLKRTAVMTFCCLVATLALYGFAPPRPRVEALAASYTIAPDSTVTATASVTIRGTLQPGDLIRYKFAQDGVVVVNLTRPEMTYTQALPAPAYGATSCYTVASRVVYTNGTQSAEKTSAPWCYTRPALPEPPAEIDSVTITPASVSMSPAGVQQFCALIYMHDGRVILDDIQTSIPACQQVLASRI
jgi:hypothetical protein